VSYRGLLTGYVLRFDCFRGFRVTWHNVIQRLGLRLSAFVTHALYHMTVW